MDAVFLNLVNISITASYIAIAVILFRFLLKKAPKAYTCILWFLVALRLVFPVSEISKFSFSSIFSLIPSTEVLPNSLIDNSSPQFNINVGIKEIDIRVNDYLNDRYAEGVTVPANVGSSLMNILGIIWIIVCTAIIIYAIGSYIYFRRKTKASVCVKGNTFICDYISTPFILGIIKPKILLPSALSEEESRYVLAHEKAHLKRLDHIWKPLGFIFLAIHWFNPIIWISYILFCRDIELACDEYVIKAMNSDDKRAYSTALLNCSVPKKLISTYPLAFGEIGVKERIKTILKYKKPAVITSIVAIILCGVTAVCFLSNPQKISLQEMLINDLDEDIVNNINYIEFDDGRFISNADGEIIIQYILNELDKIEIGKQPVLQRDSNNCAKTITIIYPKEPQYVFHKNIQTYESIERVFYYKFNFNKECSQVWIENESTQSEIYKVDNPKKILSLFASIASEQNIKTNYYRKYVYVNSKNEVIPPNIVISETNEEYEFVYSAFSSEISWGGYEYEEDNLILSSTNGRDTYRFKIVENGLIFDAKNSTELPMYKYSADAEYPESPVPDGAFFELVNE